MSLSHLSSTHAGFARRSQKEVGVWLNCTVFDHREVFNPGSLLPTSAVPHSPALRCYSKKTRRGGAMPARTQGGMN